MRPAVEPDGLARSADGSVTVTVGPGGTIRALELSVAALDEGPDHVARTVLSVARAATARAGRHVLHAHLDGMTQGSLRLLGFVEDDTLIERVGPTTPSTGRDL